MTAMPQDRGQSGQSVKKKLLNANMQKKIPFKHSKNV